MDEIQQSTLPNLNRIPGITVAVQENEKNEFGSLSNNDADSANVENRRRDDDDDVNNVFRNHDPEPKRLKHDIPNGEIMMSPAPNKAPDNSREVAGVAIDGYHNVDSNLAITEKDKAKKRAEYDVSQKSDGTVPFSTLIKNLSKEGEDIYAQYVQIFSEVQHYESISVKTLEKLLEDAQNAECNLLQQREQLRRGAQQLSQTLRLP